MKIGIDIVEVGRLKKLAKNRRFLAKVYTPEEIAYCRARKNCAQHFAVRFAAKEAVWKALGKNGTALKDIGVVNMPGGKPQILIRGRRRKGIDVSLSHTENYAVAVALIL